ncbi:expressed unknown protein [Seminavis robusta]|uniref:Uncharacterized protein n=1 Tax=Seminavis robusta TaxID=568900 RepID=A0A9N8DGI1_9STRA|nr:expressed unknown protein [Seminavis robusta]|eukprot:Sro140_g065520.1 n/a (303) ;mRNA; f:69072-69980
MMSGTTSAITQELCLAFSDFVNTLFAIPLTRNLIACLVTTGDVPEIQEFTYANPTIDMGDDIAEETVIEIPEGPYIVTEQSTGSPFHVGTKVGSSILWQAHVPITELSSILRDNIDADDNDNDVEQLLQEILTGQSGACFDCETEPGIDGVELVAMTPTTYTLELTSLKSQHIKDTITFAGPGTAAILAKMDAATTETQNAIRIFDLGRGETKTEIAGTLLGNVLSRSSLEGMAEAEALYYRALTAGDEVWRKTNNSSNSGMRLLSGEPGKSFALRVHSNEQANRFDYLVFHDSTNGLDFVN